MTCPPLVARVRVGALRLWIPLFLVWLLLLVLLAPLLLVALLVTLAVPRWRFHRLARGAYATLCETRGTRVAVEGEQGRVFVAID